MLISIFMMVVGLVIWSHGASEIFLTSKKQKMFISYEFWCGAACVFGGAEIMASFNPFF